MKLIEKKCPNCGAHLKFDNSSKEVTCNYCNATFIIDKENDNLVDELSPEFINLQSKNVKTLTKIIIFITLMIFIIVIAIFIVTFLNISKGGF